MTETAGPAECSSQRRAVELRALASDLSDSCVHGDARITGLALHSAKVSPGDLFFAVPGQHTDGHDHVHEALRRGSAALVVEHRLALAAPQLVVPSVRAAMGPLAARFYAHPSRHLPVVGVTGTNGKTTTCEVIRACVDASGAPGGVICSTGIRIGDDFRPPAGLTTPEAIDLQASLAALAERNGRAMAMEVSSHSLELHRVDAIHFAVAVFLGLTPEHLDFHKTMEHYFAAKARLFEADRSARAVICVDSPWGERLAKMCAMPCTTFSRGAAADVSYQVESHGLAGIAVHLDGAVGEITLTSPLVGSVNATNVVAAFVAARALGIEAEVAASAIATCSAPPGRFEVLSRAEDDFFVVVDYAHTPDALHALLDTARGLADGATHLVLGARGGRYVQKRAAMGATAARADRLTLTTDSPGDEDPAAIVDHLRAGIPSGARVNVQVELDRATAIRSAVGALRAGEVLLVTGRGHEGTQRFGERLVPLDDRVVARLALGARRFRDRPAAAPSKTSVAVVVPVHNGQATLARALESVLAQSRGVDQIIVVDDGSTDASVAVARRFGERVQVLQQRRLGPSAARNAGIAQAEAAWVAFLDADDDWHPRKLEWQLEAVGEDLGVVLCASHWARDADALGPRFDHTSAPARTTTDALLALNRFQTSTVLARRDALCRIGGFDPELDGAEDWDCWLRLSKLGTVIIVPHPLVRYEDNAAGYSKDLRRHHAAAMAIVTRELRGPKARHRELRAWHHLRFAVAFERVGDREAAVGCLRALRDERLIAAALPATVRRLAPFLAQRALRRLRLSPSPLGRGT